MSTRPGVADAQSLAASESSLGRESNVPFSSSPSTSHPVQASASPARRSGLMSRIFGSSRDKEVVRPLNPVVTVEGAISQSAWAGISRNSPIKTRIKTLMQLQDVLKSRTLQLSSLEGIWHDSNDMLNDPDTKVPTLKVLIEMTETQYSQLGLPLKHTFFKAIQQIGCEELSLKWLNVLSEYGKTITGFEKDMDVLVAKWVGETLLAKDHPQTLLVLELAQHLIQHNAAFIGDESLKTIVHAVCVRACKTMDPLISNCLEVLDSVLKYSDLPPSELMSVVATFCVLVCENKFREQAWSLARSLLTSQMGQRTRKALISILNGTGTGQRLHGERRANDEPNEKKMKRMLRGAIFCLANANWGTAQIDTVRCSLASIIEPMRNAVQVDETICYDVLFDIRRLIQKHGRDLQHMTWIKIVELFETVIDLCEQRLEYAQNCENSLHQILLLTEQLYSDGHFAAPPDLLYDLIEKCADRRPDTSVVKLIQYRSMNLTPLTPNWIPSMLQLVRRYSGESQRPERRSKAMSELHAFYTKYRLLYEHELVTQLMIPILQETEHESSSRIQYLMLNILFDVAKTVSLRDDARLFESVMGIVRQLFISSIVQTTAETAIEDEDDAETVVAPSRPPPRVPAAKAGSLSFDNLEVVAQSMCELLSERWSVLNLNTLGIIVGIMVDHIHAQYAAGWTGEQGADVRLRIFSALLSIHCCPITNRLTYHGFGEDWPLINVYTRRSQTPEQEGEPPGFSWSPICSAVTLAAKQDTWWPVLRAIFQQLRRVLEHIAFVKTAGTEQVDELAQALISVYQRVELGEISLHMSSEDSLPERGQTDEKQLKAQVAKFLPPILCTLLNYPCRQDLRNTELCKILVDCVAQESMEAVMACDLAIQLAPSAMAGMALVLTEALSRMHYNAVRAIPIMELLSDSAEIPEFHKFFQEKHFRSIVDTLAPYTNVHKFNTFIVASIHRVMMRWFSRVPEKMRYSIQNHIETSVRMSPFLSVPDVASGVSRQPSGDGRQVPGALFMLGGNGMPETPPPMDGAGSREERGPDRVHGEILRAMSTFFHIGQIDSDWGDPKTPDRLTEVSQEHYFVNDSIITVRTLTEQVKVKVDGALKESDVDDVFLSNPDQKGPTETSQQQTGNFNEQRRRHQSAIQARRSTNKSMDEITPRKTVDDMYATTGSLRRNSVSKVPIISWTQLIIRHMYGKSGWLMRAFEEWPADFEQTAAIPRPGSSLLLHFANQPGAVRLGRKPNDEVLQRSLRNLDRIPGIEYHAVGVLYVGMYQETEAQILANVYGSERYAKFLKLLGSTIPLDNHPGGLIPGQHGSYTYEYQDELSRITFLVATLMPQAENDPHCNMKKKLIANNFVSIVFNESGAPFKLGSVCGQFVHVALEVIPYDENNVLLQLHAKQEISCWLAIRRALLNDKCAVRLLRKMIVRSQLSVNVWRSVQDNDEQPYVSSGVDRLRKITAIREKCAMMPLSKDAL
ncbi:hypothetical protein RB195_016805 [Necator americanus]|uniref:Rap-GAP domain-containing protein n=1 Tax=Necator americanus TaxID=51031 RepID=A0ABR1C5E4_NECAM